MRRLFRTLALCAALALLAAGGARAAQQWRPALPGYVFRFPRDHGAHPAYRTEWWYFSGQLVDGGGRRYAFMLTFFRQGLRRERAREDGRPRSRWELHDLYFAHMSLLDVAAGRHLTFQRFSRGALGQAGARTGGLDVWLRDWRARAVGGGEMVIEAGEGDVHLRLRLAPRKPPVVHGIDGVSQKADGAGHASHYYSFTRLAARGELRLGGRRARVTGSAWMDHEFGSNQLGPDQVGWDWLSLQLSDGRDLMLYLMRKKDGGIDPNSSGTLVDREGGSVHLPLSAFTMEATGSWKSPQSGAVYPMGWRVRVPRAGLDVRVRPLSKAQEMITTGTTGVTYWEGGVDAEGKAGGREVTGRGFVEMTGYDPKGRPRF